MRINSRRKTMAGWSCALLVLAVFLQTAGAADTGTDPTNKYAWGENVGWANAGPTNVGQTVYVHFYEGSGGWLSGHAWGENIGWLKFKGTSPDYGVRSMAFYTQPQGTPNWWLDFHSVTETFDTGDGVSASDKYVMDVDPTVSNNYLRITAITNAPEGVDVAFIPASTRRYYTLTRRDDLTAGGWSNVVGQVAVPYGTAGEKTMQDTNTATRAFYRIDVTVTP